MTSTITIVHLSDIHFGGFADVKQIEALEDFLPDLGANAVAISPCGVSLSGR